MIIDNIDSEIFVSNYFMQYHTTEFYQILNIIPNLLLYVYFHLTIMIMNFTKHIAMTI